MNPVDILLVEDNPADVVMTLHALRKHHLANQVEVARDGEAALNYLFGDTTPAPGGPHPKLILLDLKLPKVNGLEVLRRIKTDPRTQMIPVVVLTSSQQERDVVESYRLGVNSYLVKPVDFERFMEMARQLGLYWLLLNKTP
ncbi:MAG: response regulator [Verrucomicrobiota bacterium]